MAIIDVSTLLQPVQPDAPCGPDLEYSPRYLEAARAFDGTPEVQYGSLRVAAVDPDWKRVKAATLELLAQSRDLRLAVWLTRALLALHGMVGMAEGLALIEGLLARHWDQLHPQLDVTDDFDPTARINILLALVESSGFVREVGMAPLVDSSRHGRICLRDIEAADREPVANETDLRPTPAVIDAAFADAALADIAKVRDALASAQASLERIDARLTECIGHYRSVTLAVLEHVLERASHVVAEQLSRHPAFLAAASEAALHVAPDLAQAQGAAGPASGAIAGPDDVLRTIDQLCSYYARVEPSSPVPVLLERARRLVGLRFLDAVSELAPAGLEQARHWVGPELE